MTWVDFFIMGCLAGISFGLVLSVIIEKVIEKRFKKETEQIAKDVRNIRWFRTDAK